jgi:class 3 adenylate cyclase
MLPKIRDRQQYLQNRLVKIMEVLEGRDGEYKPKDVAEDFLAKLEKDYEMRFVILCIDLKGSTKMSQELSPSDNLKIIKLFSQEMAALVDN